MAGLIGAGPTRRALLGLGAAFIAAGRGAAAERAGLLFIGNSFTAQHRIPKRVATRAEAAGRPVRAEAVTAYGADLADHAATGAAGEAIADGAWAVVVLQDHSTVALDRARAAASARAVRALAGAARGAGARVVLFVPWPRARGHALYARPATPDFRAPRGPDEMARLTLAHHRRLARATGAALAPVGPAWLAAMARGAELHAADGYHANRRGAALTARILWQAIARALP